MTKIGIFFANQKIRNIDLRRPQDGNPGIGGTQYLFVLLAYYLSQRNNGFDVTVYCNRDCPLPDSIRWVSAIHMGNLFEAAQNDGIDVLIMGPLANARQLARASEYNTKIITWSHKPLRPNELHFTTACANVARNVFVSKQHYGLHIDHEIIEKSTFIFNFINPVHGSRTDEGASVVAFMASITPDKGFHLLAKVWKYVVKRVPEAKLRVIGSGNLYDREAQLGEYGIADVGYERQFIKYLTDESGRLLESVEFVGVAGQNKDEVLGDVSIGVVNPLGTETFCLAAVEMQSRGIPVVGKGRVGLIDTVRHGQTGELYHFDLQLKHRLVSLLRDPERRERYAEAAMEFANKTFSVERALAAWEEAMNQVLSGQDAVYVRQDHIFSDFKWLRILNRYLRKLTMFRRIPSLLEIFFTVKAMVGIRGR